MKFYEKLASIGFLKNSYVLKFLFVAFIGIHIPLIGILFFVLYAKMNVSATAVLIFALIMTLIATTVTLIVLKKLIQPIELASKALNDYKTKRIIANLPLHYSDEAGLLLSNIQKSILESEKFITEKQDLIYLLSHDLKTFAGNPRSLAHMILDTNPSNEVKELSELILESSKEQFLYLEKFIKMLKEQDEIQKLDSEPKTISLTKIIEAVEGQLGHAISAKKIRLIKKIELPTIDSKVDEELLIRVIANLVNNAIKFSFSDSEVHLEIYHTNQKVCIKVTDWGIGFDNKDEEKIFSKFTNKSRLGTNNESSTGIGLYLSRQIIERNGGILTAHSEGVNKGAIFTIIFQKHSL